jgi:type IV pilus assembly protein PilO
MNELLIKLAALSSKQAFIFMGIVTGIYYFMFFDDGTMWKARIQQARSQLAEERAKEVQSDRALREMENSQALVESLSLQFQTLSRQLPTELSISEMIRNVDRTALSSGFSIKTKEPLPSSSTDLIEILPLKIQGEGNFQSIALFIYKITTLERVIRIREFLIERKTEGGAALLELSATIESFRYIFKTPETPQAPGGTS